MRLRFWRRDEGDATEVARPATPAAATPPPTTEERIEGLRAWLAQVDRKLGIRTYAIGAGAVLALAAGIVGVVLALSAKDESATKDEVRTLRNEVEATREEATQAAEESVQSLSDRLDSLETRIGELSSGQRTTEEELSVVQDDIEDIRNQISQLERSPDTGGTGSGSTGGQQPQSE